MRIITYKNNTGDYVVFNDQSDHALRELILFIRDIWPDKPLNGCQIILEE